MANVQTYIGGGVVSFEKLIDDTPTYEAPVEIGLVQNFSISTSMEYAQVMDFSGSYQELYEDALQSKEISVTFTTAEVSKQTLLMALYGTEATSTAAVGDILPDGTTAAGTETITTIDAGKLNRYDGRLTFVQSPATGPVRKFTFYKTRIKPAAELALMSNEYVTIDMEAAVYKTADGLFKVEFVSA